MLHADRIYNHALRMLGNREEAEEAVQDIFLKVHRGMAEFRGQSDIRTWLYRITVNTCLTRSRRKMRREIHPDGEDGKAENFWDILVNSRDTPEDLLIKKDMQEFFLGALELILPAEKELLLLFHVDELQYGEIARVLNIPIGTVCTQLYRARKKLRAKIFVMQKAFSG